ncbi:hypothetical protein ACFYTF_03625 [Nocardia thailandica]|uniref:DUF2510 domain-containing protein n=1 Tax=Nocardia thailandica TaxID=257275 RepID=A0ABW6PHV4_9NOCA
MNDRCDPDVARWWENGPVWTRRPGERSQDDPLPGTPIAPPTPNAPLPRLTAGLRMPDAVWARPAAERGAAIPPVYGPDAGPAAQAPGTMRATPGPALLGPVPADLGVEATVAALTPPDATPGPPVPGESAQTAPPVLCIGRLAAPGSSAIADRCAGTAESPCRGVQVARKLARLAAVRAAEAPAAAEVQLRRALLIGSCGASPRELALLRAQLVGVIAGQAGREADAAEAALAAARAWRPISAADTAHYTVVAARALRRAGRHAEAVAAFEKPLLGTRTPYTGAQLSAVRAEYADSMRRLGRHRDAAWQFTEAARLIAGRADDRHRHAELVWAAATAREQCGQLEAAVAGYVRAGVLWDQLDLQGPRERCLSAAARVWDALAAGGPRPPTR